MDHFGHFLCVYDFLLYRTTCFRNTLSPFFIRRNEFYDHKKSTGIEMQELSFVGSLYPLVVASNVFLCLDFALTFLCNFDLNFGNLNLA